MAQQQLSGTIVVIIIAVGVQACIIVFIFLKRQVQRIAGRNRRGPYTSICHGAPKALRRETDRLLGYVQDIRHEPSLHIDGTNAADLKRDYRKQIILNFQDFEGELADLSPNFIRPAGVNVRSHLLSCTSKQALAGGLGGGGCWPLVGADPKLVQHICDDYDAARHHYEPIDRSKLKLFIERLEELRTVLRRNKAVAFRNSSFLYQASPAAALQHLTSSSSSVGGGGTPTGLPGPASADKTETPGGESPTSTAARKRKSKKNSSGGGSPRPVSSVVSLENTSKEQTHVV